jgi:hypothetical protein
MRPKLNAGIVFYISVIEPEDHIEDSVVVRVVLELRYRRVPFRLSQ